MVNEWVPISAGTWLKKKNPPTISSPVMRPRKQHEYNSEYPNAPFIFRKRNVTFEY